jgi:single-strand selective monofunctional uracil DNA glycosylase
MTHPLVEISRTLRKEVDRIVFRDPVAYVYNPLAYAQKPHERYLERYGNGTKEVIFLGMNPGPFGMAQTGVPFGDIAKVRGYLGIEEPVDEVDNTHPKRPIEGFACKRSEVSGTRFWGWAEGRFPKADDFFSRFFVVNYCPLVFMEESSRNLTPDKLTKEERTALYAACDKALVRTVEVLSASWVIGIGAFGEGRAREAFEGSKRPMQFGAVLHPSPASPRANRGWAREVEADFTKLGVRF